MKEENQRKFPAEEKGLTTREAEESRRLHGSNTLTQKKRNGFFRQFLASFGDPIIKVLLAALAVNVIFLFRQSSWYESAGIAVAIFLATFVSTLSEYGSESAFLKLQQDAARIECRLKRNGKVVSCPVGDIVVGDIVLLQAGERIPADGILLSGELMVDQSALNGESKEAEKRPGPGQTEWDLRHAGQLFSGSVVSSGTGVMLVKRVGDHTFYGHMAGEMQEETRESPLRVRLNGLAESISRLGYIAAVLVAGADLFHAIVIDNGFGTAQIVAQFHNFPDLFGHLVHALTLAITVVVVAVPEGLPMMITVVLSSNMLRMLKDHVLVRKLVGVETSGSLNILFTDKTGTLTKGKLSVTKFIAGDAAEYGRLRELRRSPGLCRFVELSCLYNNESALSGKRAIGGNATDRALLEYLLPLKGGGESFRVAERIPFDSARKFSFVHIKGEGEYRLLKGAPEKILGACTRYIDADGRARPLTSLRQLRTRLGEMTRGAVRVLALALSDAPVSGEGDFKNLTLVGLVGIRDEIRPEARPAIEEVQGAGVQVVMVTGDNRETAEAIAREAGLVRAGEPERVITSGEMAKLTDEELKRRLPSLRVVARALPTDKSRLVRIAQELDLVVGMTGDGINDAPALKKADVGFAMGSGTEVAKEAGDIVILDNNFASISKAILYGRTIFTSIRKFIIFQLTMNLCAVGVSIIGPFIGIDTPVTVIQMLWINIIMDALAGLAFAGEAPLREYMQERPKRRDEPVLSRAMMHQIACMGLFTIVLCTCFLKLECTKQIFRFYENEVYFMTAFFALFIFCGVFNSFNARTPRINLLSHLSGNPMFVVIMAAVTAVQLLLIYFGGSLFRTAGLTFRELMVVTALSALVIPVDGIRKIILRRQRGKRQAKRQAEIISGSRGKKSPSA